MVSGSTTLPNSASTLSPAVFARRPLWPACGKQILVRFTLDNRRCANRRSDQLRADRRHRKVKEAANRSGSPTHAQIYRDQAVFNVGLSLRDRRISRGQRIRSTSLPMRIGIAGATPIVTPHLRTAGTWRAAPGHDSLVSPKRNGTLDRDVDGDMTRNQDRQSLPAATPK